MGIYKKLTIAFVITITLAVIIITMIIIKIVKQQTGHQTNRNAQELDRFRPPTINKESVEQITSAIGIIKTTRKNIVSKSPNTFIHSSVAEPSTTVDHIQNLTQLCKGIADKYRFSQDSTVQNTGTPVVGSNLIYTTPDVIHNTLENIGIRVSFMYSTCNHKVTQ